MLGNHEPLANWLMVLQLSSTSHVCNWVLAFYVRTTVPPYSFSVPTYSFFRKNHFFRRNRFSVEKQFLRNLKHLRFIFQRQCIPKKAMNS